MAETFGEGITNPTAEQLLRRALNRYGFDGLCTDDCGCLAEDLAPCCVQENLLTCVAGYKVVGKDGQWEVRAEKSKVTVIIHCFQHGCQAKVSTTEGWTTTKQLALDMGWWFGPGDTDPCYCSEHAPKEEESHADA